MNKYLLFLIIVLMSSLCYAQVLKGGSASLAREQPAISIDAEANTAQVVYSKASIEVDKYTVEANDTVNLYITSSEAVTSICFDFPVNTAFININQIEQSVPFWFDSDLKPNEEISDNSICYTGLSLTDNQIYYKAEYKGRSTIEYNITLSNGAVLDPYLIGNLGTSNQVVLSIPFNGSSNNVWSAKANNLNNSNVRYNTTKYSASWDNTVYDPAYGYDSNYATYAYTNFRESGNIYTDYARTLNDSGMILETKYGPSNPVDLRYYNDTTPDICFNAYTDHVGYKFTISAYNMYQNGCDGNVGSEFQIYCNTGDNWQLMIDNQFCYTDRNVYPQFYDSAVRITNQTNFTAYSYPTVKTQYFNLNGLVYSNSYNFWGNDSVNSLKNDVNTSQTAIAYNTPTFDTNGLTLNGVNQYINSTNVLGNLGSGSYSVYIKAKTTTPGVTILAEKRNIDNTVLPIYIYSYSTGIHCSIQNATSSTVDTGGSITNFWDGNYHTVVCIRDSVNHKLIMYYDGVNIENASESLGDLSNSSTPLKIGVAYFGNWFNGTVQDVKVYNRSLSSSEVAILNAGGNFSTNLLGESNSSIYLNGNEYINVQNNSLPNGSYSTSQWVYITNFNGGSGIWTAIETSRLMAFYYYAAGFAPPLTFPYYFNSWHNIITTNNGTYAKVYYDGVLTNESSLSGTSNIATGPFKIGAYDLINYNYIGKLSNFLMYNYALSDNEIQTLYNGFNSSLNISIYDQATNQLMNQTVNLLIYTNTTSYSYSTGNGNIFINVIPQGSYAISVTSTGYNQAIQAVTIGANTHQNITIYMQNSTTGLSTVLTVRDQDSGQLINNALASIFGFVNGTWTVLESKYTDISGKAQFSYMPQTPYKFLVSKSGYQDYTFILNPILSNAYDVLLSKTVLVNFSYTLDGITLLTSPNYFTDGASNTFNFMIVSPNSTLIEYGYNLTLPDTTTYMTQGTNPKGQQLNLTFSLSGTTTNQVVRIDYYYITNLSGRRNLTLNIPIVYNSSNPALNNTMWSNQNNTYGMSMLERILIATFIVLISVGIATLIGQPIPGFVLGLVLYSFMAFSGFIPLWATIPGLLIGFFLIAWRSGGA